MRIICPNCSVHYEIADDLIPSDGREVQCSNCGRAWYVNGVPISPAVAAGGGDPASAGDGDDDPDPEETDVEPDPDDDLEDDATALPEDDADYEDEDEEADRGGMPSAIPRASANEAILRVLREERDHEAQRRRVGTAPMRPEPTPAVPPPDAARQRAAAERRRMAAAAEHARTREATGNRTERAAKARPDPAASDTGERKKVDPGIGPRPDAEPPRKMRRELLPDIEEINSSLRPDESGTTPEGEDREDVAAGGSTGFWGGFLAACAFVGLFVLIYALADEIAAALPTTADPLADYVDWIDVQRTALAHWVEALTARMLSET